MNINEYLQKGKINIYNTRCQSPKTETKKLNFQPNPLASKNPIKVNQDESQDMIPDTNLNIIKTDSNSSGSYMDKENQSNSYDSENILQTQPIVKREDSDTNIAYCLVHRKKKAKYYDVSFPDKLFCSKCALDIFINNPKTAYSEEECTKRTHIQEFLNQICNMNLELSQQKSRIINEIKNIEESKIKQEFYLNDFFANINSMINQQQTTYSDSIKQSFTSLRKIFLNKVEKISGFELEMEELEKDIKSNYSNIIKLMEIDPFYEIMHRYNSKVTKIRNVFTTIKNQPAEIPENPLRVKNEITHDGFIKLISKRVDNFQCESNDSIDSNSEDSYGKKQNSAQKPKLLWENILDENKSSNKLEIKSLENFVVFPERRFEKIDFCGDTNEFFNSPMKKNCEIATQTNNQVSYYDVKIPFDKTMSNTKKSSSKNNQNDDLKDQAEFLIRSVDSLLLHKDEMRSKSQSFKKIPIHNPNYDIEALNQQYYQTNLSLKTGKDYKTNNNLKKVSSDSNITTVPMTINPSICNPHSNQSHLYLTSPQSKAVIDAQLDNLISTQRNEQLSENEINQIENAQHKKVISNLFSTNGDNGSKMDSSPILEQKMQIDPRVIDYMNKKSASYDSNLQRNSELSNNNIEIGQNQIPLYKTQSPNHLQKSNIQSNTNERVRTLTPNEKVYEKYLMDNITDNPHSMQIIKSHLDSQESSVKIDTDRQFNMEMQINNQPHQVIQNNMINNINSKVISNNSTNSNWRENNEGERISDKVKNAMISNYKFKNIMLNNLNSKPSGQLVNTNQPNLSKQMSLEKNLDFYNEINIKTSPQMPSKNPGQIYQDKLMTCRKLKNTGKQLQGFFNTASLGHDRNSATANKIPNNHSETESASSMYIKTFNDRINPKVFNKMAPYATNTITKSTDYEEKAKALAQTKMNTHFFSTQALEKKISSKTLNTENSQLKTLEERIKETSQDKSKKQQDPNRETRIFNKRNSRNVNKNVPNSTTNRYNDSEFKLININEVKSMDVNLKTNPHKGIEILSKRNSKSTKHIDKPRLQLANHSTINNIGLQEKNEYEILNVQTAKSKSDSLQPKHKNEVSLKTAKSKTSKNLNKNIKDNGISNSNSVHSNKFEQTHRDELNKSQKKSGMSNISNRNQITQQIIFGNFIGKQEVNQSPQLHNKISQTKHLFNHNSSEHVKNNNGLSIDSSGNIAKPKSQNVNLNQHNSRELVFNNESNALNKNKKQAKHERLLYLYKKNKQLNNEQKN